MPAARAYGRRAPSNKPALRFADIRRRDAVLPAHPGAEDYLAKLSGWQVLGNDTIGDCNAVTWANSRRLTTALLTGRESYPGLDQVLAFYRTQNPDFDPNGTARGNGPGSPADAGMDIQTGLEQLHRAGGPDGVKAVAFAKVDPTDREEVAAALAVFGFLWTGMCVLQANLDQFDYGATWTRVPGSPIDGRHAVLTGGYSQRRHKFVTWGKETRLADDFWFGQVQGSALVDEAWVVVWPEHLGSTGFQRGVDLTALIDAYHAVTGDVLDVAAPGGGGGDQPPHPAPIPDPNPTPDAADRLLADTAHRWLAHPPAGAASRELAGALGGWLAAHGR